METKQPMTLAEVLKTSQRTQTTRKVFRLPVDAATAAKWLATCYVDTQRRVLPIDNETRRHISNVAQQLTDADNPKWGLMLAGKFGNGKSTMLRAIYYVMVFLRTKAKYTDHAFGVLAYKATEIRSMSDERLASLKNADVLMIDDLGEEPAETKEYGNVKTPLTELLISRYETGLLTIVSTNLDPKRLHEHYGGRVTDRFREMFYVEPYLEQSYRK